MNQEQIKDTIRNTRTVRLTQAAHKLVEDEMLYIFLDTRGNDELGYLTSVDSWFMPERGKMDCYETIYESEIYPTILESMRAVTDVVRDMVTDEVWIADAVI